MSDHPDTTRGIMAFPKIGEFYNELVDRLTMVLEQFFLNDPFTIFINALPRDHEEGTKIYVDRFKGIDELVYAGLEQQRSFLERENGERRNIDTYWDQLGNRAWKLDSGNTKISTELFFELRRGDYALNDIERIGTGYLRDYFKPLLHPELRLKPLTVVQEAEYHILNAYFDIQSYRYLSLPLIQFAEFDGVVHIILSEKDYNENFIDRNGEFSTRVVGNVIKAFSREYEGLILDWDIVGGARLKEESFLDALKVDKFYSEHSNPILNELGYREYYEKHRKYFEDRLSYSKQVPLGLRAQYRQIAIIHILLDSYAHNISAHSLTTLEWWFRQRSNMLNNKDSADKQKLYQNEKNGQPQVALLDKDNLGIPLDGEIHPLLRFLLDKGAFWTGLTRDNSFGGRIVSLYNILWRDFINNPLYLGTIAFTEGVARINIHITLLKLVSHEKHVRYKKIVELDDNFASVDLTQFYEAKDSSDLQHVSRFVKKGDRFDEIAKKLWEYKGFFPGGVVGAHSFFTILETELRNVKHYSQEQMETIRRDGLTLNISIEDYDYTENRKTQKTKYYKIGVWLKQPIKITKELILLRPKRLGKDIIEREIFIPVLGGTNQDKVCAAMLFNNSFSSVERRESERDRRFYPWLKVGSSKDIHYKEGDYIEDYELSARRLNLIEDAHVSEEERLEMEPSRLFFEADFTEHQGYFKKFFHIWKGEIIHQVSDLEELEYNQEIENISRFKFVCIPADNPVFYQRIREQGIIRIIHQPTEDRAEAYRHWLNRWLAIDKAPARTILLELSVESNVAAQLSCDSNGITYRSVSGKNLLVDVTPTLEINLVHRPEQQDQSNNEAVRYRSHGIMMMRFMKGKKLYEVESMAADLAAELLEVLGSSVCIFDNRVAARFKKLDSGIFAEQLRCAVHEEDHGKWESEKKEDFFRYNFLVVHLSFIESFKDEKGEKKYDERDIKNFIDQEILNGRKIPDNFILVITTGRGRTNWWERLRTLSREGVKPDETPPPAYTSFVTFRPVESLTAAIENALTISDDIELKYRLVKVLFGS
jgi:hypothetical protein